MNPIYESAWHHPFVAYVCGALLTFALARRLSFLHGYLLVFLVVILADATVTGAWSPVTRFTSEYKTFSVIFILLGDLRYFVLAERWAKPTRSLGQVLLVATAVTLIVPLTTGALTKVVPAMQDDRVLYIVYETAMVFLTLGFAKMRMQGESLDPKTTTAIRRTSYFFATLYAGWSLSDVLILSGVEFGHIARIVPNVMYYGGFLPVVLWAGSAIDAEPARA